MCAEKASRFVPRACVYETTLACDARCIHCGSSAGRPRADELSVDEALRLFDGLAALGCRSVTLSGGEPLIREDWPVLADGIRSAGMRAELITNGLRVESQADEIARAGFFAVSFSVDGPADVHDRLRGVPGALNRLRNGAEALVARGVRIAAVTQVNRHNLPGLDQIHDFLVASGFEGWQVQLTMSHGRAVSARDELCLAPEQLESLERALLSIKSRTGLFVQAADNLGYLSSSEPQLRAGRPGQESVYGGCQAGMRVVGVTSDGVVRGCLSLPPAFDEGSLRERELAQIWNDPRAFSYNRRFSVDDLVEPCRGCVFVRVCRGGCRSLAYSVAGTLSANPLCLHFIQSGRGMS